MTKRRRSDNNGGYEEMQAEKSFPHPEGAIFVVYKQFVQSSGNWPQRKLKYLTCPFCVL
jgi:hypothetical protein